LTVREWDGGPLRGPWLLSRKLDGVQIIVYDVGEGCTKGGQWCAVPDSLDPGIYEYFPGSWADAMRGHRVGGLAEHYYQLLPMLDDRLVLGWVDTATVDELERALQARVAAGDEGLVCWTDGADPVKLKPVQTVEVRVRDVLPGKGRLAGTMGRLLTSRGFVGTGFTDEDRAWWWAQGEAARGLIIEVAAQGPVSADGPLRHARFVRVRLDT
jgi:hypothetical protein